MGDLFDSTVNLEEQFIAEGRTEGLKAGEAAGLREGKQLGLSKGLEIGLEVGFINGCVQTWQAVQRRQPGTFDKRVLNGIAALRRMVDNFPQDPQDDGLQECMAVLRSKFKAVVVAMGFGDKYFPDRPGDHPTMDF